MAVQPLFLSLMVNQLIGFVQVSALYMLQHISASYWAIDKIDLKEKGVKLWSLMTLRNLYPV